MKRFYHVCIGCTAKWFSKRRAHRCPRCKTPFISGERLIPPWLTYVRKNLRPS